MQTDIERSASMGQATKEKLRRFTARIERLEAEKAELSADIREVYAEVKSFGFDVKVLRKTIALRKIEAAERAEQAAMVDLYMDVTQGDLFAAPVKVVVTGPDGFEADITKAMAL